LAKKNRAKALLENNFLGGNGGKQELSLKTDLTLDLRIYDIHLYSTVLCGLMVNRQRLSTGNKGN
jgi:hypothetical protein